MGSRWRKGNKPGCGRVVYLYESQARKMNCKYLKYMAVALSAALTTTSCIEDGHTTSPSDQPEFSVDVLDMGVVFTTDKSPTHSFVVRNRHDKILTISDIRFNDPADEEVFHLNVDGLSGTTFSGIEIRPNDSIFVFADAQLPANGNGLLTARRAQLDFTVNGVVSSMCLEVQGQDVERLKDMHISADTRFSADLPYQIFDNLTVDEGATLTLDAGVRLHFHAGAGLVVNGRLVTEGTAEAPILMDGDRFGAVVGRIPYEIMSNQWTGVTFGGQSTGNRMAYTVVRNTTNGVTLDGEDPAESTVPDLDLLNCRLTNSGANVLYARNRNVKAVGTEFSEASAGLVYIEGGSHTFNHCTLANNYLFTAIAGPALYIEGEETALRMSNSIIYGIGGDVYPGDLTDRDALIERCILKSAGTDDDNFVSILWEADPMFLTVRNDYYFDYRLGDESEAREAGDPALTLLEAMTDFYGRQRTGMPDLGAYVYAPVEQPEE